MVFLGPMIGPMIASFIVIHRFRLKVDDLYIGNPRVYIGFRMDSIGVRLWPGFWVPSHRHPDSLPMSTRKLRWPWVGPIFTRYVLSREWA